jgi:hypothetical protein
MKNYLQLLTILLISIWGIGCESSFRTNNNGTLIKDSTVIITSTTDSVRIKPSIVKFLFLKKGMTHNDVQDYLNTNLIKHSKLKSLKPGDIKIYDKTKYMEVYDYQIGDVTLDVFKLYFIDNQLYEFKYFKHILETDWNDENRGFNKVNDFARKHMNVMYEMYDGLKSKYGNPTVSEFSNSDSIVTFYPTYPNKDDCIFFIVDWNEDIDSVDSDTEIRINMGNSFCSWRKILVNGKKTEHSYNQNITINFFNSRIRKFLKEQNNLREVEDKHRKDIKMDSIKNKKQQFIDNL